MSNNKSPLTKAKSLLSGGKQNFVIILAAIVLFVVFYLINPGFASKGNLLTMTKALVPYATLSGRYLCYRHRRYRPVHRYCLLRLRCSGRRTVQDRCFR